MRLCIKSTWSLVAVTAVLSACSGESTEPIDNAEGALSTSPAPTLSASKSAATATALSAATPTLTAAAAPEAGTCADEATPSFDLVKQNATPVKLAKVSDGVLRLDASEGKVMMPTPQKARSFASQKEFVAFAKEQLGAVEVFDKDGKLTGLRGTLEQFGVPVTLDETKKSVNVVADPVATFLGGNDGFVTVEGKDLCLTEKCASEKGQFAANASSEVQPLGSRTVCAGSLCLNGGTYKMQILNYHRGGAWTDVSGVSLLCSWFGWFCPAPADELYVAATYAKTNGTRWGFQEARVPRTAHVEVSRWAIDWWIFGRSGDGDLVETEGVCGRHTGRRGNDNVSFTTSEGNTHGACP